MAVVLKTYGEQLAEVQLAISAVMTSQRYEINGRMMQRADLQWLQARDKYLTDMLGRYGDVIAGSATTCGMARVSFN